MTIRSIGMNALMVALVSIGAPAMARAQQAKGSTNAPVSVTGCLAQGAQANEYSIRDADGKTYGLSGTQVDMKPHVGHTVTITGTPTVSPANQDPNSAKAAQSENLVVTDLKMVSASCR